MTISWAHATVEASGFAVVSPGGLKERIRRKTVVEIRRTARSSNTGAKVSERCIVKRNSPYKSFVKVARRVIFRTEVLG
jgi:hypothetical protein